MNSDHWLDYLVNMMDDLHKKTGGVVNTFGNDPIKGSIADIEMSSSKYSEKILTAYAQGSLMLEVTMDHFSSVSRTITQPVLTISPWTTLRSLMESASIGLWLLDTTIDIQERIFRSLKFRCEGLLQQKKFGDVAIENSNIRSPEDRYYEVLKLSETLGLDLVRDDNGNVKQLRHEMPSITNLTRDYLDLENEYRLFSAIAHAHPWALQALSFKNANIPDRLLLEKNLSAESIQYIGNLVFPISKSVIVEKFKLYGWPHKEISQLFTDTQSKFSNTVNQVMAQ